MKGQESGRREKQGEKVRGREQDRERVKLVLPMLLLCTFERFQSQYVKTTLTGLDRVCGLPAALGWAVASCPWDQLPCTQMTGTQHDGPQGGGALRSPPGPTRWGPLSTWPRPRHPRQRQEG